MAESFRDTMKDVMECMARAGWVSTFVIYDDPKRIVVKWTADGLVKFQTLCTLGRELSPQLASDELVALFAAVDDGAFATFLQK